MRTITISTLGLVVFIAAAVGVARPNDEEKKQLLPEGDLSKVKSVTISPAGERRIIVLDEKRREIFLKELADVIKKDDKPSKGIPPRVAPDCEIVVSFSDGSTRTLELLGNFAVLHDTISDETRQFYFGRTIRQWATDNDPKK